MPARNTNTQHLRDGFTRSLLQRMRQQSQTMTEDEEKEILDAIRDFKTKFVNAKVKKDTEFVFTKTRDGTFKMEYLVRIGKRCYEPLDWSSDFSRAKIWALWTTNGWLSTLSWPTWIPTFLQVKLLSKALPLASTHWWILPHHPLLSWLLW